MNKKISTLMAGFLLAGGLFSTANAEDLLKAEDGQYYKLAGTAQCANGSSWNARTDWYLVDNEGRTMFEASADDESAYWTVKKRSIESGTDVQLVNVATGKPLKLTVGDKSSEWFRVVNYSTNFESTGKEGAALMWGDDYYLSFIQQGTEYAISSSQASTPYPLAINAIPVDPVVYNVNKIADLAKDNGNGETFNLSIGAQVWNKDDMKWEGFEAYNPLNGNVFTGDLKAEKSTDGSHVRLIAADGKYIVLTNDPWGTLSGELGGISIGYKFATMTQKQIDDDAEKDEPTIVAQYFTISKPSTKDGAPVEVVVTDGTEEYELQVAVVDDKAYLTVGENLSKDETEAIDKYKADYTVGNNADGKPANNTYVRFGADNNADYNVFYDKVWNITRQGVDGGAVEVADPANNDKYVPVAQVALGQPEGQWIYTGNRTFINRESGKTLTINGLRTTDDANVYAYGSTYNYTIVAVGEPGNYNFNGYFGGEYNAEQLKVKTFRIGTPIASTGDTTYMTLGDDNQIAWSTDATEAIEFRFTQVANADGISLVRHITDYEGLNEDGDIVAKKDTLNFYRYNIADLSGRILNFDNTADKRYELINVTEGTGNNAGKYYNEAGTQVYPINIIFKAKDNNCYNILIANPSNNDNNFTAPAGDVKNYMTRANAFSNLWKAYGSHNSNELTGWSTTVKNYNFVQNDLFVIEDAIANLYRSVGTTAALDTIKIFRNEDNNYVMYESGKLATVSEDNLEGFLAIQNFLDPRFAEKNPAMYADTAAGFNTWRPQFMLAVDATIVPAGKWCELDQSSTCAHAVPTPGYVSGRYLVNLVDSAVVAEREDCIYQNYGTAGDYYRLGFVNAKHIGDTLVIASTGDSISLLNNEIDKVCTFAFRYVDNESEAFIIETAYNAPKHATASDVAAGYAEKIGDLIYGEAVDFDGVQMGYIKYHNGVPVVTSQRSEAEVFDLEVLENIIPTANETIADEAEGVQVIAGNGAVTIQGAAGKTVVITNILGKAVANTTLTSDNQTINVPAGIVVVTVDGEAVKAIVK